MKPFTPMRLWFLTSFLAFLFACDSICEPQVPEVEFCHQPEANGEVLFITGFEPPIDSTEWIAGLGFWSDTISAIQVDVDYGSDGGAMGSQFYAKLVIEGNDGQSIEDWSGGGLVLDLTNCTQGIDLSDYDLLQFEAKVFPNSAIEFTHVKLQGAPLAEMRNDSTPERPLSQYGVFPSEDWETISIPLDSFKLVHAWEEWVPFDEEHGLRFVTSTVNNFSPHPFDGALGIDNVRFAKN